MAVLCFSTYAMQCPLTSRVSEVIGCFSLLLLLASQALVFRSWLRAAQQMWVGLPCLGFTRLLTLGLLSQCYTFHSSVSHRPSLRLLGPSLLMLPGPPSRPAFGVPSICGVGPGAGHRPCVAGTSVLWPPLARSVFCPALFFVCLVCL